MVAILKLSRQIENLTRQLICICVKNINTIFHPDPISNGGALGFFKEVTKQEQKQQNEY